MFSVVPNVPGMAVFTQCLCILVWYTITRHDDSVRGSVVPYVWRNHAMRMHTCTRTVYEYSTRRFSTKHQQHSVVTAESSASGTWYVI